MRRGIRHELVCLIAAASGLCVTPALGQQLGAIGTISAYAGRIVDLPKGFLPCDGREFSRDELPELWAAIGTAWGKGSRDGTARLPNLTGMFLRGVDDRTSTVDGDIDAASRQASAPGGNRGARVGSMQLWATGLPRAGFSTSDESRRHSHAASTNSHTGGDDRRFDNDNDRGFNGGATVSVGDNVEHHSHVVEGGDIETRPVNAAVYWVIRVQ